MSAGLERPTAGFFVLEARFGAAAGGGGDEAKDRLAPPRFGSTMGSGGGGGGASTFGLAAPLGGGFSFLLMTEELNATS